jgi:hypothetical protein
VQQVYLTRRNLLTLLAKLDQAAGDEQECSIIKTDRVHPEYPCSAVIRVTAVEDAMYYTDRKPGRMSNRVETALAEMEAKRVRA